VEAAVTAVVIAAVVITAAVITAAVIAAVGEAGLAGVGRAASKRLRKPGIAQTMLARLVKLDTQHPRKGIGIIRAQQRIQQFLILTPL
jgi:hypothetical protein